MDKSELFIRAIDASHDSIRVLTKGNKIDLPSHTHHKAQFSYAEGDATFIITKDKEFMLPARHYAWIPSGMEHRLLYKYRTHAIYTFYIPQSLLPDTDFYNRIGVYPVTSLLLEMILYSANWTGDILANSLGYEFVSTLVKLLPELHSQSLPFALPTTTNPRMQEILKYIQAHLHVKLTLEFISKKFNYSERTFSRSFQILLGTSFFQYMKMARIIRAMEFLLRTEKSVSEIAFETGYESISAFSNTFHSLAGMRPSDFRALNR
ncbi:MAG: AraC family transcriptional regulator [Arachidicoccus sp.]|nr:AraC family transcriptional regulator [Arachidicoccus sp.]